MKIFGTALICLLLATVSIGQGHYAYVGAGVATIRGESTAEFIDNDYGWIVNPKYLIPFPNERWVITTEASFSDITVRREFFGPEGSEYRMVVKQTYFGAGLRYYLNKSVERYNPYPGQILPFAGFSIGGLFTSRTENSRLTPPSPLVIPNGYGMQDGNTFTFAGHGEGGFVIVINPHCKMVLSGFLRAAFDDSWDGILGKGPGQDFFYAGCVGMHIHF